MKHIFFITVFTSKSTLVKEYKADGTKSIPSQLYEGQYLIYKLDNIFELQNLLLWLNQQQCICIGGSITGYNGWIVTNENLASAPYAVSRSKKYFKFFGDLPYIQSDYPSSGSILVFDIDYDEQAPKHFKHESFEAIRETLIKIIPELEKVSILLKWSSSSKIIKADGSYLNNKTNFHIFVLAINVTEANIEVFKEYLKRVQWAKDYGYLKVSSDGKTLARTILDMSIYSPERILITSEPLLPQGWSKERDNLIIDGEVLDLNKINYTHLPDSKFTIWDLEAKMGLNTKMISSKRINPPLYMENILISESLEKKLEKIKYFLNNNTKFTAKELLLMIDRDVVKYILNKLGFEINNNYKFKIREEKTASTSIATNGFIYDFGGVFKGNIINFLEKIYDLNFVNALNYLKKILQGTNTISNLDKKLNRPDEFDIKIKENQNEK